jgi:hypothetical protein
MPKRTYKIQGFHGGINSNADPRDIKDIESPNLIDVNVDKVGKVNLLGNTQLIDNDYDHNITILANKGLFVMNSDRKLDGTLSDESIVFNYNFNDTNIDGVDSSGSFQDDLINFPSSISPVYYSTDGALRVSDSGFSNDGRFFGYIEDNKFTSLNSFSGEIDWYDSEQFISTPPLSGTVLISTPYEGSDTATGNSKGLNSASAELIGAYVNDSGSGVGNLELLGTGAVNLRVGIQYNIALETSASNWTITNGGTGGINNQIYLFENSNQKIDGSSHTADNNSVEDTNGPTFTVDESNSFVFGMWFLSAELNKLASVSVTLLTSSGDKLAYIFPVEEFTDLQRWNIISCSTSNLSASTASFGDTFSSWKISIQQKSGNSSNAAPSFTISGPVIAKTDLNGFVAGEYTFWHSYLYDNAKQESLLRQFDHADGAYGLNKLKILGSPLLFNFDIYINPFSSRIFTTGDGVDVDQNTIDSTSHGLIDGDTIKLEGVKNATGISNNNLYYVVQSTTDTFKIADTKGGSAKSISGSDDTLTTGTATAGTSSTITLASGSSSSDDAYNGYVIYTTAGTGAFQYRVISDYVGSSKVASVSQDWGTTPSTDTQYKIGVTFQKYSFNKRIIGTRLYYKLKTNDSHYLIGEVDFKEKGFKWFPESDVYAYDLQNTSDTTVPILNNTSIVKAILPSSANYVDTFKSINGFSNEVEYINARYKTAVVHGRRVYIGNIQRPNGRRYPDRIVKSLVNKFDSFPQNTNSIDVAINDGESITKLEAFADRILQFKKNSLYIINVSENVDFLEDTFRNKGCSFDYHVIKTDYGISWFNNFGVYFYDGKQVINLLEKNGMRLINESDWEAFITDGEDGVADDPDMSSAHIGYIPKKRQLLIRNENTDIFIYDFVLQSWMKGSSKIFKSGNLTNFALKDEELIYFTGSNSLLYKWSPSSSTSTNFQYQSKDIDFGEPGVRKKIYKVYITYKTGGTTNVQVKYDVNGGTTFGLLFKDGTNFTSNELANAGSGSWIQSILKPNTSSEANNIYSFALKFTTDGTVPSTFEINDITIIYRIKNPR